MKQLKQQGVVANIHTTGRGPDRSQLRLRLQRRHQHQLQMKEARSADPEQVAVLGDFI